MNTAPQTEEQKEKIAKFGRNLAIHVGGFHPTAIGAIPGAVETVVEEEYKVWEGGGGGGREGEGGGGRGREGGGCLIVVFCYCYCYWFFFYYYLFVFFLITRMLRFWERLFPKN